MRPGERECSSDITIEFDRFSLEGFQEDRVRHTAIIGRDGNTGRHNEHGEDPIIIGRQVACNDRDQHERKGRVERIRTLADGQGAETWELEYAVR